MISPCIGDDTALAKTRVDAFNPTHAAVTSIVDVSSSSASCVRRKSVHGDSRTMLTVPASLCAPLSSATTYSNESLALVSSPTYAKHNTSASAVADVTFVPSRTTRDIVPASSHAYNRPLSGARVILTDVARSPRHVATFSGHTASSSSNGNRTRSGTPTTATTRAFPARGAAFARTTRTRTTTRSTATPSSSSSSSFRLSRASK